MIYDTENEPATAADRVTWLALPFRSRKHREHFLNSMLLMLAYLGWSYCAPASALSVGLFAAGIHTAVAVTAVRETEWGRHNGVKYSRDCIWFNAMLALAYLVLFSFAVRHVIIAAR